MAIMVPNNAVITNAGERRTYNFLKETLPQDVVIYHNKEVKGQEFDFCALIPKRGIVIIEVKGWKETNEIEVKNDDDIIYRGRSGFEQYYNSPKKQARKYRFNLLNKIKEELDYNPLIIDMVCYPNLSKEYYKSVRLDLVSEEEWTIFKGDILDRNKFINKLGEAFDIAKNWGDNSALSSERMLDIRRLFESEEQIRLTIPKDISKESEEESNIRTNYSLFQLVTDNNQINNLFAEYKKGTKLYLVAKNKDVYTSVVKYHRKLIYDLGLKYDKDLLKVDYDREEFLEKAVSGTTYLGFNIVCTYSTEKEIPSSIVSISILDGNKKGIEENKRVLEWFNDNTGFNLNQYRVEHAPKDENVLVRAGAGTGKTFSMISRLTFLHYINDYSPDKFIKKIVMLTFTNEASDEMKSRLKERFQNYYMLTKNDIFFKLVEKIDTMNISTIHSLSKAIIQKFSSYLGYGVDMDLASGDFDRKEVIAEQLEEYLQKKIKEDPGFTDKLNIPIHKLIDILLQILSKLQNKSMDIASEDLVFKGPDDENIIFDIIEEVLKDAEIKYQEKLNNNNKIHLNDLIIKLNKLIDNGVDVTSIKGVDYLFVDEFQDTDNIQIDLMKRFQNKLDFKFFVVGDIKQCIYRFRGAEEEAFERLVELPKDGWNDISLRKNYRTDCYLLGYFEEKFQKWSQGKVKKLKYILNEDQLISGININEHREKTEYYRKVRVNSPYNKEQFGKELIKEILSRKEEIKEKIYNGDTLKEKQRTIAILVRENWEAQEIREIGKYADRYYEGASTIFIETDTGEELYASDPALDLYKLIMALKYPVNPKHIFNLTTSSYFYDLLDVKDIFGIIDEEQVNNLIEIIDYYLEGCVTELGITDKDIPTTWYGWCEKLKYEPVLKVLHNLINILRPWNQYALNYKEEIDEKIKARRFYKRNIELLFEKLATSKNQDYMTINSLENSLKIKITTGQKEDIRQAYEIEDNNEIKVKCITVHKSKGLEFDTVILPYGHRKMNELKKNANVELFVDENKVGYKIKSIDIEDRNRDIEFSNSFFNEQQEKEDRMKEETRILYVALTRAIRNFTFFLYTNKSYPSSWQELLKE